MVSSPKRNKGNDTYISDVNRSCVHFHLFFQRNVHGATWKEGHQYPWSHCSSKHLPDDVDKFICFSTSDCICRIFSASSSISFTLALIASKSCNEYIRLLGSMRDKQARFVLSRQVLCGVMQEAIEPCPIITVCLRYPSLLNLQHYEPAWGYEKCLPVTE